MHGEGQPIICDVATCLDDIDPCDYPQLATILQALPQGEFFMSQIMTQLAHSSPL